ncbi:S-adenosyl-L-methionine-dependent methyltransferase [Xylariales sp. PMI_506]|nr:S-adenosyl-L-methionine-dependent methyltransferase [Xylariales sp. PMI_506]
MPSANDDYRLSREPTESKRLDEQHRLYIKSFGYLLHPLIVDRLPPSPHIADIATGTAVVLRDLATELPMAQLHGFDISTKQFPANLPSNITLHIADCKRPFPPEFHGKFDVVHLRLLVVAMEPPQDWETVGRNVFALLKPGGALQWVEGQFSQRLSVLRQGLGCTTSALENLYEVAYDAAGRHRMAWNLRGLKAILGKVGLVDITHEVISSDCFPENRALGTKLGIEVWHGSLKTTGAVDSETLEKMRLDAIRDGESGAYTRWDIHCYVAFKPF